MNDFNDSIKVLVEANAELTAMMVSVGKKERKWVREQIDRNNTLIDQLSGWDEATPQPKVSPPQPKTAATSTPQPCDPDDPATWTIDRINVTRGKTLQALFVAQGKAYGIDNGKGFHSYNSRANDSTGKRYNKHGTTGVANVRAEIVSRQREHDRLAAGNGYESMTDAPNIDQLVKLNQGKPKPKAKAKGKAKPKAKPKAKAKAKAKGKTKKSTHPLFNTTAQVRHENVVSNVRLIRKLFKKAVKAQHSPDTFRGMIKAAKRDYYAALNDKGIDAFCGCASGYRCKYAVSEDAGYINPINNNDGSYKVKTHPKAFVRG